MIEHTRSSPAVTIFHVSVTIGVIATITYVCTRLVVVNSTTVALANLIVFEPPPK